MLKTMATLSLTIFKNKSDRLGRCVVYISICVNSRRAYINTGIKCLPTHFKNGRIIKEHNAAELNQELGNLIYNYEKKLRADRIANLMTPKKIKNFLLSEGDDNIVTFSSVTEKYIRMLKENGGAENTIMMYQNMFKTFREFCKSDILLSDLTNDYIMSFVSSLQKKRTAAGVQFIMSCFKRIVHYAEENGLVKYDISPFLGVKIPKSQPRTLDITLPEMKSLKETSLKARGQQFARDMFLLSFYLGGINYKDIVKVDLSGKELEYSRSKTSKKTGGEKTIITIQPEAGEIIKRIGLNKQNQLDIKDPTVSGLKCINQSLRLIAKKANIVSRMSFYSARKSFVQYGVQLGIPLYILEYCIGQTMKTDRPIYNYFRIIQPQADAAIRKIIDYMLSGGAKKDN